MYKWEVSIQTNNPDTPKTIYVNAENLQQLLTTIDGFGIDDEDIIKIERQQK